MKNNGQVIQGKLLVKRDETVNKTASGIYIPETVENKPNKGTVITVGEPLKDRKKEVEPGDFVFFNEHAGTTINFDDEDLSLDGEYVLLEQSQILYIKKQ